MTKYLVLFSALFIAGCYTADIYTVKKTEFKRGHVYMFSHENEDECLVVHLLNDTKKMRLRAFNQKKKNITEIPKEDPSVMNVEYFVNAEGNISFRYYSNDECSTELPKHPFNVSASTEPDGKCSVRYLLKYKNAKMIK